jgi:ribosome biogenesis GTPase A
MFGKQNHPLNEEPNIVVDTIDTDDYIESLRRELLYLIEKKLTPLAMKYQYTSLPLESRIKWKPMILVLGNYSSGKSTLINEFLGCKVQNTGQAPTDDAFTVLTCEESEADLADYPEGTVYEERDGNVLMNDEQYPFDMLRKHGEKFAAHFRLKKVKSRLLRNLVIVDTPGMLDSVSELDRGYDYQGVIGDLAMVSDLVLVLFDPHKAGTIKESHFSIRKTLPEKTFEDRVVFVLNRVDECSNLEDLLRVYGTLCWNLSSMTGRKDMPRILLTYSPSVSQIPLNEVSLTLDTGGSGREYLNLLENQRQELTQLMLDAPRYRLDHLASFVEFHSRRMSFFLQELLQYRKDIRRYLWSWALTGLLISGASAGAGALYVYSQRLWETSTLETIALAAGGAALLLYLSFHLLILRGLVLWKRKQIIRSLQDKKTFSSAEQQEGWHHIKPKLIHFLQHSWHRRPSITQLRKELESVEAVHSKGAKGIRNAIHRIGDKV